MAKVKTPLEDLTWLPKELRMQAIPMFSRRSYLQGRWRASARYRRASELVKAVSLDPAEPVPVVFFCRVCTTGWADRDVTIRHILASHGSFLS